MSSSISQAERLFLADHVYKSDQSGKLIGPPPGYTVVDSKECGSGLEIYALKKNNTNEIVFAVRSSDDGKDWTLDGPNASHFFGKLHPQDLEAMIFVDKFIKKME